MRARSPLPLLVALAAGCGRPPLPERGAGPALTLLPASAEVWAWRVRVEGRGPEALAACRVVGGAAPVEARVDGFAFSAQVPLRPGAQRVHAECTAARGGTMRSPDALLDARASARPVARLRAEPDGRGALLDAGASAPSEADGAPLASFAWDDAACSGPTCRVPRPAAARTVRVVVTDGAGRSDSAAVRLVPDGSALAIVDDSGDGGPEAAVAVVYGVVPPLFGPRPLHDVTAALDDLRDLGVTALWLAPLCETPPGDYGYAVTDYFRVRPDYGSEDDLRALVEGAHRRGMRVLLDLVPDHTSDAHRYFREAEALGPASHYFRFYQRDAAGRPVHWFDWTNLPNLAVDEPEVRRLLLEATTYWMRSFGVDGWRVDAAWGVRDRAPGFWEAWRREVRRRVPDALLVAEASAREASWGEAGFDAAYDWTGELGHGAWEHAFDEPGRVADRLHEAVRAARTRPFLFLENNDTGARFVTRHGAAATRVAAAALLTLPGMPCLFTGEERGAEYEPYARREPLPAGDPNGLRAWYRALVRLRRDTPALRTPRYERLPAEGDALVFLRGAPPEELLVVLNFSEKAVLVPVPERFRRGRFLLDPPGDVRPHPVSALLRVEGGGVRVISAR